ncbi:zinc-ribbon domain-containing protein [Bifidobacterium adolescentis]|uniref:zinc-ribbon domain-containing protein n=1 Tax=Bifidobacterium adolescentis TaxID=1680 RepID=UPI003A4D45FD
MACPNCGQPTIEGAKFCASCGSPLTQTTAAAPQAPAAPESDDGTMLSSAPHMAPAPQMPTAAVPLPNSAAPAAPQTTVPQPTTPATGGASTADRSGAGNANGGTTGRADAAVPVCAIPGPAAGSSAAAKPADPANRPSGGRSHHHRADHTAVHEDHGRQPRHRSRRERGVRAARIDRLLHGQCRGQQRACRHSGLFRHRLLPGQQRCVRFRPEFLPDSLHRDDARRWRFAESQNQLPGLLSEQSRH